MQQRAGLARALAINPSVLLMDEPFGALDAQTRELMQEELLRILENEKKTMLFVTHSIDEAIVLGDRIVDDVPPPGRIKEILPGGYSAPEKNSFSQGPPTLHRTKKFHLGDAQAGSDSRTPGENSMSRPVKVRLLSLVFVLFSWEFYGRRVNPILFTYPLLSFAPFSALSFQVNCRVT